MSKTRSDSIRKFRERPDFVRPVTGQDSLRDAPSRGTSPVNLNRSGRMVVQTMSSPLNDNIRHLFDSGPDGAPAA